MNTAICTGCGAPKYNKFGCNMYHFVRKYLLFGCFAVVGELYTAPITAEVRPISMSLSKPRYMKSDNPAKQKADYVLPYRYLHYDTDRIYEPRQYSCSLKNKLKYCVTNKGRALNGQIVEAVDNVVYYQTFQNGYQSGVTSAYSSDGTLINRSYFKKGVKDGEEIQYFMNGNAYLVMKYKDGALNGRVEQYDVNGGLIGEMTYKNGWFKSGYCKNERKGQSMHNRSKNSEYNEIIPCGE